VVEQGGQVFMDVAAMAMDKSIMSMAQSLFSLNWMGPFMTVLIWLVIVAVALWTIDILFPRIQRSHDDRSEFDA
jgi:hypothetical protein